MPKDIWRMDKRAPAKPSIWNMDLSEIFLRRARAMPTMELSIFCRKLACLLDASTSIERAIALLIGQSRPAIRPALTEVQAGVMQGKSLSAAMTAAGVFPSFLCGMCRIGEMTARLSLVLMQLASFYEQQAHAKEEIIAALMYPLAVMLLLLAVMIASIVVVLPGYARIFSASEVDLPWLTRVLLQLSDAITANIPLLSLGLILITLMAVIAFRSKPGRAFVDWAMLSAPVARVIYGKLVNVRFSQGMSLLLTAGQPLAEAVLICSEIVHNERVRRDLCIVSSGLTEGRPLWELLKPIPYFDPMLWTMAQVGDESGRLPFTMSHCKDYLNQEYATMIRRLNKLVEPVVTIWLGIVLGIVMMAVILPTFALTNVI